jgi:hypothetical protein
MSVDRYEHEHDEDEFRNKIATINEEGKRAWIYPKNPQVSFTTTAKR